MLAPLITQVTGGDPLVIGTLTLAPNFETIGVKCTYTGDSNAVATATVQFKPASSGSWQDAYVKMPDMIDRRATITTSGVNDNSANVNQLRLSIVGLDPGTEYDVRVTWSSAEGVTGTNPVELSTTTVDVTPTTGGSVFTVPGDFASIALAIAGTAAGDEIRLEDTYTQAGLTISTSGSVGAYRRLFVNPGDVATITSTIVLNADYWWIDGLTMADLAGNAYTLSNGADHIYIDDTDGGEVANTSTAPDTKAAFFLTSNNTHVYIRNNRFYCNLATNFNTDLLVYGVRPGTGSSQIVVDGNQFLGVGTNGFLDTIGGGSATSMTNMTNIDFCNNICTGFRDDGMEFDGSGINCRAWGNVLSTAVTAGVGVQGLGVSLAPLIVGPTYIFRNLFVLTGTGAQGVKYYNLGSPAQMTAYLFHNTWDFEGATGGSKPLAIGAVYSNYLNNIAVTRGNFHENGETSTDTDYTSWWTAQAADCTTNWGGAAGDYATMDDFFTATGEEEHSTSGSTANGVDPDLQGADRTILNTSVAYDAGVVIPNFNSLDSAWPYKSTAPDNGYYEVPDVAGGFTPRLTLMGVG